MIHYYHQQGRCGYASFIYYYFPPTNRGSNLARAILKMVHHMSQSVSLGIRQNTMKTLQHQHSFILYSETIY